jgi:dsDNA-binding SOS-regulon protein
MAVETRFVVVRRGNEIMTFADKKAADEYDRMLDMADNLTQLFSESGLELTDKLQEDLGVYLAKNREEVLISLLAKKRPPAAGPKAVEDIPQEDKPAAKKKKPVKKDTKAAA